MALSVDTDTFGFVLEEYVVSVTARFLPLLETCHLASSGFLHDRRWGQKMQNDFIPAKWFGEDREQE
jgi:hypothetical protein